MNKFVLVEGVWKCKDIFFILVKENEKVKRGYYKEMFKYKLFRLF